MEEQEIREWLDQNNRQLLSDIEAILPVRFTIWREDCYACQVHKDDVGKDSEAEIFYKEPISQPKIAHELLHVKTGLVLGNNGIMFTVPSPSIMLDALLSNAEGIGNVCEHLIFFPDYLAMGYDEVDSFEPAEDLDDRLNELSGLARDGLKENGKYSQTKVSTYLGLIFSFLFYPNEKRFSKEIKQLKRIDFPLFSRINKLRIACKDLDIDPNNRAFIQRAYYDFAVEMNDWFMKAFPNVNLA